MQPKEERRRNEEKALREVRHKQAHEHTHNWSTGRRGEKGAGKLFKETITKSSQIY